MGKLDDAIAGAKLLLVYWRVPVAIPPAANEKSEDRTAAKLLALIAVVVLGFAIRGRARAGPLSAAAIPTVAAAIAGILDSILRQLLRGVHDGMILPVYVTTPLIMLGYLIFDTVVRQMNWQWYQQHSYGHEFIFPISLSSFVILLGLLIWSSVRQNALVGLGALFQGVVVVLLSGLIVYFVAKTPAAYVCALGGCASH